MKDRWRAVIHYRTGLGSVDVEYFFEELDELADLVESGPDWNAIEKIEVFLHLSTGEVTLWMARENLSL